jgi:hypothetical protein
MDVVFFVLVMYDGRSIKSVVWPATAVPKINDLVMFTEEILV